MIKVKNTDKRRIKRKKYIKYLTDDIAFAKLFFPAEKMYIENQIRLLNESI